MDQQNDKRTEQKTIYYTPDELEGLETESRAAGLPVAVFIRERSLGRKPKARPHAAQREAINAMTRALSKIANNYLQLHRAIEGPWAEEAQNIGQQLAGELWERAYEGDFKHDVAFDVARRIDEVGQAINAQARIANSGKPVDEAALSGATDALGKALEIAFPENKAGHAG